MGKPLDPLFSREPTVSQAASMLQQLMSEDNAMNRVITAQRFKLLHSTGTVDLTYTMCALSDERSPVLSIPRHKTMLGFAELSVGVNGVVHDVPEQSVAVTARSAS